MTTATAQNPRYVDSELINRLDPLEQVIAAKFVNEGKWIVKDSEDKDK